MPSKPKRGRPSTGGRDPLRSLRIDDETWQAIQQAAAAKQTSVSAFIRDTVSAAIRRLARAELRKGKG